MKKNKRKTTPLLLLTLAVLGCASCVGVTSKTAFPTKVYAASTNNWYIQNLMVYESTTHTPTPSFKNAFEYSESNYVTTGITIYSPNNTGNTYSSSSMQVTSNSFYIDFTNANRCRYPVSDEDGVAVDTKYQFNVYNSSGTLVFYERFSATDPIGTSSITQTYSGIGVSTKTIYLKSDNETTDSYKVDPQYYGKRNVYLANGNYSIEIVREYVWVDTKNTLAIYNASSKSVTSMTVDGTAPTIDMKDSLGNAVNNGAYSNKKVTITATDTNFSHINCKKPGDSQYYSFSSKTLTLGDTAGWYYVYAVDSLKNESDVYSFYYDPSVPTGYIQSNGSTIPNGSYISKPFIYSCSDGQSGIDKVYYKAPFMTSYQEYTSGTIIPSNAGDGWYYFYSVDKAGNMSTVMKVFLETAEPVFTLYKNNTSVYNHNITKNETIDTGLYYKKSDLVKIGYSSVSNVATTNISKNTNYTAGSLSGDTYTISVTTATGLCAHYLIHVVEDAPTLTMNNNVLINGSTNYVNADTRVFANIDTAILDSGETGMRITSKGAHVVDEFITYKEAKNYLLSTPNGTETTYYITLTDVAGNMQNYIITVDKANPEGNWLSGSNVLANGGYTNQSFLFDFNESLYSASISYNGGEYQDYHKESFDEDGTYTVVLTDKAGNKSSYTITHDTVDPVGTLYADYKEVSSGSTVNAKVYFSWDEDATCTVNDMPYQKNSVLTKDGKYTFVLTDKAGNMSKYYIEIDTIAPSYNYESLNNRNTEVISKWYSVDFDGNRKSFKTYEAALNYAKELEYSKYVTQLYLDNIDSFTQTHLIADGDCVKEGNYYRYKSAQNSNTELYYFDQEILDNIITNYAKNYVSNINYYDYEKEQDLGALDNSMFDNIWINYDGVNAPIVNDYLFTKTDAVEIYARLTGTQDSYTKLDSNKTFGEQFTITGLYEIKEVDKAGNTAIYYVFLDKEAPTLKVDAEVFGEGETKEISINADTLESINSYYYKSFNIKEIFDNDTWAMVKVSKNGKANYYTKEDELPLLDEGGKYLITAYDRLGNYYSFNVYIVGEEANVNFTPNTDSTEFNVDISLDQDFDTVISLEIYKDGEKLSGVTPDNLHYTFTKDGFYTVIIKDNFGRTIEKNYDFNKSLPNGNLSIEANTKTKEEVDFTYDSSKYYAEVYKKGTLFKTDNTGNISCLDDGIYQIKLINLTDEDNYNLYSFEIDNKAPEITLSGVENNGTTNKDVCVNWDDPSANAVLKDSSGNEVIIQNGTIISEEGTYEVVAYDELGNSSTMTFTIDKSLSYVINVGNESVCDLDTPTSNNVSIYAEEELNVAVTKDGQPYQYKFGDVLSEEGTYRFVITDACGNTTQFNIVIDKSVDVHTNVGNGSITNDDVVIVMGENGTVVVTKDGMPYEYKFGQKITEEGKYEVTVYDAYGNEKHISFEIVHGTKTTLDYSLGNDVEIVEVKHNGEVISWDSNSLNFTEDGTYEVTVLADGEEYTFTLSLDTTAPEITLNGIEDGETKNISVSLTDLTEEGTVEVYKDGELIDYTLGDEITDYGHYTVIVKDALGNARTYTFTLEYQVNGWGIALIGIGVVLVGGLVTLIILKKKRVFKK